jgi:hypothetical protein
MKNIYEVLSQKELKLSRLEKEVEPARLRRMPLRNPAAAGRTTQQRAGNVLRMPVTIRPWLGATSSQRRSVLMHRLRWSDQPCDGRNSPQGCGRAPAQRERSEEYHGSLRDGGNRRFQQSILQPTHEGVVDEVHAVSVVA